MTSRQKEIIDRGISNARDMHILERESRKRYKKAVTYFKSFSLILILTLITVLWLNL